jgi:hypothetical protein
MLLLQEGSSFVVLAGDDLEFLVAQLLLFSTRTVSPRWVRELEPMTGAELTTPPRKHVQNCTFIYYTVSGGTTEYY